jgi:hypothetical protein
MFPLDDVAEDRRAALRPGSEGADQIRRIGVRAHGIGRGKRGDGSTHARASATTTGGADGRATAVDGAEATGRSTGGRQQEPAA